MAGEEPRWMLETGPYAKMNTQKCNLTREKLLGKKCLYILIYLVRTTRKSLVNYAGVVGTA